MTPGVEGQQFELNAEIPLQASCFICNRYIEDVEYVRGERLAHKECWPKLEQMSLFDDS